MANPLMHWHFVTSAQYKAAGTGDVPAVVANDLYFISDTKEIRRGSEIFSPAVDFYTTQSGLPADPAANRIYFNADTLEGKVYNGTAWVDIIKPLGAVEAANTDKGVSGKAVVDYVTEALKNYSSSTIVTSISWDKENMVLTTKMMDESQSTLILEGVPVNLKINDQKNQISLVDVNGNQVGTPISIDLERFVKSGEYDAVAKNIVLYFDEEKQDKVEIPVGDLIDTYTAKSTSTVEMKVESNEFSAEVKISAEEGNDLVKKEDGLYVKAPQTDITGKMDKVTGATVGHLPMLTAEGQLEDSGIAADDLGKNPVKLYIGASIEAATADATPNHGDICVVETPIEGTTDKVSRTAYMYDSGLATWKALDGNVNASNVYFDQDMTITTPFGYITLTNGQATWNLKGKNLLQGLDLALSKESNPTVTQPSVTVSCPQAKAYEVGTSVTPNFTATLNAGKYEFGPATGVTATEWAIVDTASHAASANTGAFDAFTVADDTNYKITATAKYANGAVPKTNKGNEYAAGQIKAGSKSGTSAAITGFRAGFYGTLKTKDGEINSALVRSLPTKTSAKVSQGTVWNLAVPVGATRVVFAYDASIRDVNSVLDVNGMNAEIKTAFTKYTVDVEGANNYTAKSYKVYVMDFASANDVANTLKITL